MTVKNTPYIIRPSLENNNRLMKVWSKVWEERIAISELLRQRQNGRYTINSSKLHCVRKEWQMDGILCSRHTFILYDTKQQCLPWDQGINMSVKINLLKVYKKQKFVVIKIFFLYLCVYF